MAGKASMNRKNSRTGDKCGIQHPRLAIKNYGLLNSIGHIYLIRYNYSGEQKNESKPDHFKSSFKKGCASTKGHSDSQTLNSC